MIEGLLAQCAVADETAAEAEAQRLTGLGIAHGGAEPGGGGRIFRLHDPDGNRVVLTSA